MIVFRENDDYEPLTWVRGVPLYVTTLLVALHCVALAVVLLAGGLWGASWVGALPFNSAAVLERGSLWQWVTYAFVNRATNPLFFVIEMIFFYLFGREVERYVGRRKFAALYAALVITPPMILTLVGAILGPSKAITLEGSGSLHLAIFLAFARLYPGVEFFLRIRAAWMASGLFGLYLLFSLSNRDWGGACALVSDASVVLLGVAWLQGTLPGWPQGWSRRQWDKVATIRRKGNRAEPASPRVSGSDPMEAIDPLLDKIARHGMGSLTPAERQALENARRALIDKPKR